ncbi:MAG: sulfite exporter TauE/SafE family protein [Planctomycetota bacterium]
MLDLFNPTQIPPLLWCLAALGSVGFGLSKTGIPGVGILGVALFAVVFKKSPGLALPLLIVADFVAGYAYYKLAIWSKMFRMFPWAAIGIFIGFWVMGVINEQPDKEVAASTLNHIIGGILIALVAVSIWWRWLRKTAVDPETPDTQGLAFEIGVGVISGFTTMIANAAGPIMILYLLRMKLPKMQFIGTCSLFFLVLNCFKVPFMMYNGMITMETMRVDLQFIPFSLLGAFVGWALIKKINQALFESLCLGFTAVAAVWLVVK